MSHFKIVLIWIVSILCLSSAQALNAPTSLNVISSSSSQLSLSWIDQSALESGFTIERSLSSFSGFVELTRTAANAVSFTNTLLPSGTYFYRVRAFRKKSGITTYSSYSNVASGTILSTTPVPAPATTTTLFSDTFSSYATGACLADGQTFGAWTSDFAGYGCNSVVTIPEGPALSLKPQASVAANETHAGLATGPSFSGSYIFETTMKTQQQLRVGSTPNPWEVGWVVWNYQDNFHFYYFIAKPNGWELGKEDPAYPGAQRFLAAGSSPTFAIGDWHNIVITQKNNVITVSVNGITLTTFTDLERPYSSGKIGFYSEDSQVVLKSVRVTTAP